MAAGVLVTMPVLAACDPTYVVSQVKSDTANYALRHSWGPDPALENGKANSCVTRGSDVANRAHLCRSLDGYEEMGDNRNWLINYEGRIEDGQRPLQRNGARAGTHGQVIITHGGAVYEGCNWYEETNNYYCDYRQSKAAVPRTNGLSHNGYILRKLWDWTGYVGNTAGCAGGITTVWNGSKVTALLLRGCADGPMSSGWSTSSVASGAQLNDDVGGARHVQPEIPAIDEDHGLNDRWE